MKLAIMQPYAFPYLGYFQLMNSADRFVLLDDVTFIKQGWINRNRILGPHGPLRITLPVEGASSHRRICDLRLAENPPWRDKLLRTVEQAYRRATQFDRVWPLVETILRHPDRRLSHWLRHSLELTAAALGITTPMVSAAEAHPAGAARGLERVLEICGREGASDYINAEGGRALYTAAAFAGRGLRLHFLDHVPLPYPQRGGPFVERLSVIDTLMHNAPAALKTRLASCRVAPSAPSAPSGGGEIPAAPAPVPISS